MIAWRQRGISSSASSAQSRRRTVRVVEPVLAASAAGTRFTSGNALQRLADLVRRGEIERHAHPLVGVVPELGDPGTLQPGLDRQQPDRRRQRGIEGELGRAHRRAPRGRRQQPLAEIGEEDRVDELRLAARELRDERDDQLVLAKALLHVAEP